MSVLSELRKVFWPIEKHECKKFLPMAAMMFCILFNYSALRSIKDGFAVTAIGPEAISFLKTYVVLPSAVISMIIYTKLCNILDQRKIFYVITSFFIAYLVIFAFALYPYPEQCRPNLDTIEVLSEKYRNFQWFIKIVGHWDVATFYTIAELWGSIMLSLLFWQFANQITKTEEAKRFYSMFGLLGNASLPLAAFVISYYLNPKAILSSKLPFIPILIIIILSAFITMFLYRWLNKHVVTDPALCSPEQGSTKKKAKLSLKESFRMIMSSKYLGLIAILILSYGVSINLVEGVWKSKLRLLYPSKEEYTMFMGEFQAWQGVASIIFMIIGSNILRRVSWGTAAAFTPIMIFFTGLAFFSFIIFDNVIVLYMGAVFSSVSPLVIAVMIGMIQNVLSKATKYSLFDSTKEMAYIPLDDESKSKGKAAVDVIGGRFGKSGGGLIQSTFFILLPSFTFDEATPYFAVIFFVIVLIWLWGIKSLNTEYTQKLNNQE